jgi:hypothetical protein
MSRAITVLSALLLVAAAGCASTPNTPTSPTTFAIVDYTRQGGIVGIDDHLIVYDSGSATLTRRTATFTFNVDATLLSRLREQLTAADFDRLDPEYGPPFGCCDQFTHRVRHRGRSVRALDGDAPERLRALLITLSEIIAAGTR